MKHFNEYLTKNDFSYINNSIKEASDRSEYVSNVLNFTSNVFEDKLKDYIVDLSNEKIIQAPEGFDTCALPMLSMIGKLYNPEKYYTKEDAASRIAHNLSKSFYMRCCGLYSENKDKSKEERNAAIDEFFNNYADQISNGNFEYFEIDCEDRCAITDKYIKYQFKNWAVEPVFYDNDRKMTPYLPPESPGIKVNKITLETGHILAADWFRIEAFTKTVRDKKDHSRPSINSIDGTDQEQQRFAEKFNFFSINVGNSSPTLFEFDGQVMAGHIYEDREDAEVLDEQYRRLGHVCTDLWNVTIIDKAQLIKIVASSEGDNAEKIVEDYIKVNDIVEFHVSPGEYYSYSTGSTSRFVEMMDQYDVELENFDDVYFILSDHELPMKHEQSLSM